MFANVHNAQEKILLIVAFGLFTFVGVLNSEPAGVWANGLVLYFAMKGYIDETARIAKQPIARFMLLQAILLLFVYDFLNSLAWWFGEVVLVSMAILAFMHAFRRVDT